MLKPDISDNDLRSSNNGDNIGFNLYVFHLRYQKNVEFSPPIKVEINFSENVPAGIYGCALVLTSNIVSISSDVQRHFYLY